VVEDLAMVLVLVLLPALAGAGWAAVARAAPRSPACGTLGATLLQVAIFVA
jgi:predicted Kef-type K+ transport protein